MNKIKRKYQIFISSTFIDLAEERQKVIDIILSMGHIPIGMEFFNASAESQWDKIKRTIEESDYYIIILGCMINKDGSLTNLLKGRVDKAIEFSKMPKERTNKDITFITSGGKGNDEPISEGLAMKNYLVKNKIDENRIIVEDKSTDTFENFKFSMKKIKNKKNVAYSTTNFHVFRAGVEASKLGLNVEGIGSKTKRYFWINAFIREFIATIYYERKNHLIIFGMILLINALMILILYISNLF